MKILYTFAALLSLLLVLAVMRGANPQEPAVWWVWAMWPKDITWIAMAPAMSYSDCVDRMLPRVRMLVNKTTAWDQPRFKCEVK